MESDGHVVLVLSEPTVPENAFVPFFILLYRPPKGTKTPHAGSIWQQATGLGRCWAESSGWEFHLSSEGHVFLVGHFVVFKMFSKGTCTSCHWLTSKSKMNQPGFYEFKVVFSNMFRGIQSEALQGYAGAVQADVGPSVDHGHSASTEATLNPSG